MQTAVAFPVGRLIGQGLVDHPPGEDLRVTDAFARRLGRPRAAGRSVGSVDLRATVAGDPATLRGNVACVDAKTSKAVWTAKIDGVTNFSSPAVTGGKVANAGVVVFGRCNFTISDR